jgi:hypothetical protein
MRIHPAESRIKKLSVETPAILILFDMLLDSKRQQPDRAASGKAARSTRALLQGGAQRDRTEALALHDRPGRGAALARHCARRS